jgi:predicted PurR-regulated permease PerM
MASRSIQRQPAVVARRALVASIVVLSLAVLALALWKIKLVLGLLFAAVVIACAMRPTVEALRTRGVPRAVGIGLHYAALVGLIALVVWFAAPRAVSQVQNALGELPQTRAQLEQEARKSDGLKHDFLVGLERRLSRVQAGDLASHAVELTRGAVEAIVGVFFVFAAAAYWLSERRRAQRLVLSLVPPAKRKVVCHTWDLVELKLGAFVRGQILLILLVSTVLSLVFWAIGLPYWLLVGVFAGIVELVPVLGPLAAGALAVGVGFSVSWQVALMAGLAVLVVRLLEDYLLMPRVLGNAVGLSPLVVLVAVSAAGVVLGPLAVVLAIPLAALVVTLIDVLVLDKDPAEEDVPAVIFPAKEGETIGSR